MKSTLVRCLLMVMGLHAPLITAATANKSLDKFFKWTDENGVIHYGDRVPPEQSQKRQEAVNKYGMTVGVTSAAKTQEQLIEDERKARIADEERRKSAEQINQDRILLTSYANANDLELVYQGKLETIDGIIKITETNINFLQQSREDYMTQAAAHERSGQIITDELRKKIANTQVLISKHEAYIAEKRSEQTEIKAQRDAELKRFRELRR